MRSKALRIASLLVAVAFTFTSLLIGCGKKEQTANDTQGTAAKADDNKPVSMTETFRGGQSSVVQPNIDFIIKKIKEKFNVDMKFDFIDANVYEEKLRVMIAADQYSEAFWMNNASAIKDAVEAGKILPVTDMYKNDPAWKKVDPKLLKPVTFNNEIFAIVPNKSLPNSLYYRVDWAKKLNISPPKNPDELYKMWTAFTKNDPDGNGKDDTYGLAISSIFDQGDELWYMFLPAALPMQQSSGSGLYVDTKDNTVKNVFELKDDVIASLTYLNKAYKEGLMDKEFVTAKQSDAESKFLTGKAGTWPKGAHLIIPRYDKIKPNFPNADIDSVPVMSVKYGKSYKTNDVGSNFYVLSDKVKNKDRAMKVMAYLWGGEGQLDWIAGEQGAMYKIENNKMVWLKPEAKSTYNPGMLLTATTELKLPVPEPILERSLKAIEGFDVVPDTSFTAGSELFKNKYPDIAKTASAAITKMIIGQEPVSNYDKLLQELKKAGLDEVTADVNKIYKAQKK